MNKIDLDRDHYLELENNEISNLPIIVYDEADRWLSYKKILSAAGDDAGGGTMDDPVTIVYTSGTTGRPKGSLLTQNALFYNAANAIAAHDITRYDHGLTTLPMFHVGGMNIHTTPSIHAGAMTTIQARFVPVDTLAAISNRKPTIFLTVPAMPLSMIAHPDWETTNLSSLRFVGIGSAAVPEVVLRAFLVRGIPATQIYGLTESAPIAICLPLADVERKMGSCGKPALHTKARIVDNQDRPVIPGEAGEIHLQGENLFAKYWRNELDTNEAHEGEWFRTGDIGHQDEDGYYYIDERKTDVVISGGENIYPAELENILADCTDLIEAAVIGRPDGRWGEVPIACVVRRPESNIQDAEILELFEGRLARFKHPRAVVFLKALPRNAMGKVEKFTLRAQFVENKP